MTKRFTTRNGVFYTDTNTGYEFQCYGEVVDLLNELAEENEELKKELDKLELVNEMLSMDFSNSEHELWRENRQLKNRLKDWHQRTFKAHEYFNILEKVIDEVCDDDISNEIWKEYGKREKLIE